MPKLSTLWSSERAVLLPQIAGIRSRTDGADADLATPSPATSACMHCSREMNPAENRLLPPINAGNAHARG